MRLGRPSLLGLNGLTQQTELPERNSRFTPASRIFTTLSYWRMSQYSSWPTLRNALHFSPRSGAEHVAVGAVGHVVAVLLQPVGQRELERQELAGADRQRIVDDARVLRLAAVGPVEADVGPGALVALGVRVDRVVVGPAVVGLPGVVAALEEDVGRAVVADDEDDVALPVRLVVRCRAASSAGPGRRRWASRRESSARPTAPSGTRAGPLAGRAGWAAACPRTARAWSSAAPRGRRSSPCGRSRSGTSPPARCRP